MIPASTHHLMRLLEEAARLVAGRYQFTVKPHPGYPINLGDYPGLEAEETNAALGQILGDYDVAVAANSTSASVDAYLASLPVIIGLDGDELNLSPLRGRPGLRFVSNCTEMLEALETSGQGTAVADSDLEHFFFLERDLPRWKRLLAIAG
jgi:surface carbohydrate biosynthesis protein (TIGR04326 family)